MSKIIFSEDGWEDYIYWQCLDKKTVKKINSLLKSIQRTPFEEEGKPEPLRNENGDWSRKINDKDRIVYRIVDGDILVKQCRGHYNDH